MPIQINEVVIKATVSDKPKSESTNNPENCDPQASDSNSMADEIVEKVLEILKSKSER